MIARIVGTPIEERERGVALVMVIGIGAIVMALIATLVVVAVNGARYARNDVDWNGALAAAYAGIDEYQSRLAADPGYILHGNPSAPFSAGSTLTADRGNPAFGFDGAWATVVGSDRTASYRYEIDTSDYDDEQLVRVRSTGRVGDETRTVVADLRQAGFAHYLYFTDMEIQDPAVTKLGSTCYRYRWSSPARPSSCGTITFADNDVVNGQVHSNDIIYACGARFEGRVSTAWNPASGVRYRCDSGTASRFAVPDPQRGASPFYQPVLPMPETNTEIRAAALETGCLFTGPTSIVLNSNGTMTVRSPLTRATRPGSANATPAACGSIAGLGSTSGATIAVPDQGAVYVQNVPSGRTDPNYRARPTGCASSNALGYPLSNERAPDAIAGVAPYDCHSGDLFVRGTLDGEVTLAAENFIYVVGSTRLVSQDDDMLGLIGNSMVYVWNPALRSGSSYRPSSPSITIEAAILSLRSFAVQNTSESGGRGTLTVRGSISQAFRGVVAQNSGYDKDYRYDPRMRTESPPHFLSPTTIAYGVTTWIETSPAYAADGSVR